MSPDELLTVGDVVRRWGKADTTVRRDLTKGKMPNAQPPGHEGRGAWGIPLADLLDLYGPEGLAPDEAAEVVSPTEVAELREILRDAEAQRLDLQHRIEVLEAERAGYLRTIKALEGNAEVLETLRAITPTLTVMAARVEQQAALEVTTSPPRRRWWNRRAEVE
jgi:hypothetical protein